MRQQLISPRFSLIIPVFLVALLMPWNHRDTKNSLLKGVDTTSPDRQYVDLRNFPVLRISKADMINLFTKQAGERRVHKLVFKFNINDAEPLNPSLTAFRAKQRGRRYMGTSTTLSRVDQTCEITGEYTLGNLELHKDEWRAVLASANTATYLYFYPKREQYNGAGLYNVVYKLYWGNDAAPYACSEWLKMAPPPPPDGGLNPSPPANPE